MKKFARVICALFICMFAFLSVGCFGIGSDSDFHDMLIEMYKNGEITLEELQEQLKNSMSTPMYGTKVLYRPEHYDYDGAVGEGNEEYFGQFAFVILDALTRTYGTTSLTDYLSQQQLDLDYYNNTSQKYYYDSIRYNLYSQEEYNTKIIYEEDVNGSITYNGKKYSEKWSESDFATISINTENAWNWTFGVIANPNGYIINEENNILGTLTPSINDITTSTRLIQNSYYIDGNSNDYFNNLSIHYTQNQTQYILSYLGTESQQETENYSDYVKALEYVIYCITMDLTPANIDVTINADGTPNVKIGNFADVDSALTYIKEVFDKIGTYVGVSTAKAERIKEYILTNVIGANALNNDSVSITKYDTVKVYQNSDGTQHTEIVGSTISEPPLPIHRDYEGVLNNIFDAIYKDVHIGSESDDTINNRYPASEIIDYYGNNFFISADKEFANIKPLEYQSAVLMFSEDVTIDNLMLHFKYDAGLDGDDNYDPNASITINVYVNFYDHSEKRYYEKLVKETIVVKDGPFDFGNENNTMCLFGIAPVRGDGIEIEAFEPEIGNGVMKTMEYDGLTSISDPIRLIGTTQLKNYYQIVEPKESTLDQNVYYSYGILNPLQFAGTDGCDYLEIAYEVIKTTGDVDTNYKFYTGLGTVA